METETPIEAQRRVFNSGKGGEEIEFTPIPAEQNESIFVESSKDSEKNEGPVKQRVDFLNKSAASTLFASQSKKKVEDSEENKGSNGEQKPPEQKQDEKKTAYNSIPSQDLPKAEELYDVSYVIMEFFDAGVSNICSAIALGMKPSEFELTIPKKQQLSRNLSVILAKHQVKMSIEALFVIAVCLAYSSPLKKAVSVRKAKKEKMKDEVQQATVIDSDNNETSQTGRPHKGRTR